jgi:hypothetical protein
MVAAKRRLFGEMRRERRKELGPMAAHGWQDSPNEQAAGSRLRNDSGQTDAGEIKTTAQRSAGGLS